MVKGLASVWMSVSSLLWRRGPSSKSNRGHPDAGKAGAIGVITSDIRLFRPAWRELVGVEAFFGPGVAVVVVTLFFPQAGLIVF